MITEPAGSRRSAREFRGGALRQVQVRIGDVKVAAGASVLYTVGLGSCVAIALYDAQQAVGGMAHAMLPHPHSGRKDAPRGRFAATAVPDLIADMEAEGASRQQLRARVAGGAAMFRDVLEGEGLSLGRRNVDAARDALALAGIPVDGEDVFGSWGRSVFLRTADGRLLVTSVAQADVLL
jgi:chemotaxis protein CheD